MTQNKKVYIIRNSYQTRTLIYLLEEEEEEEEKGVNKD
jgi:hypothetical protein